ncbi:hypothetical protein QE152_g14436 [Popillia japonica]|uniref:CCHC-type domain-containing protein n=1 Tax=Popillia japonica TaxID=7064 RepID=A0AAW1L9H2_POPJA
MEIDDEASNKGDFEKRLEEALVFGRRSSLARTPPPTPPTITEQQEEDDQWQDEEVGGSPIYQLTQEEGLVHVTKKRKLGQMSPAKEREARLESNREDMKEVNSSFAKVLKRTKELEKLVKESTKTKVEIKHVTRELAYLVNNLEKSINKYQAQHDCIQQEVIQSAVISQLITVKSLRPSWDGNQIGTVEVSRSHANFLLSAGRIKIGWVKCRVQDRVAVTRCYKCLEFGYITKECKGPDRSDATSV